VRENELGLGLGNGLANCARKPKMELTRKHTMGHLEPCWGRQRGGITNSWSRSHPPCGDESGGGVTGEGHPPVGTDWGGQPCGSCCSSHPPWLDPHVDWPGWDTGHPKRPAALVPAGCDLGKGLCSGK
jgi:hypothetical protein